MKDYDRTDFDDEEMPCPCTVCSGWFDLNDGKEHPRKEGHVICSRCAHNIQENVDDEEEMEELLEGIKEAEYTIKENNKRLEELNNKKKNYDS